MSILGLDKALQVLDALGELPRTLEASTTAQHLEVLIAESSRNLYTQHRAGRHVAAMTLPAVGKTAWISVIEPHEGTSRGGERTRFETREQALEHSREHTEEIAQGQAADLLEAEWERI